MNTKNIDRPILRTAQIWNMSVGFLGIQVGFALQNANASRILQTFGADVEHLSWFWLAAPLTGMIVQPIIGFYSDKTWNRLGRRKPYFLAGAILTTLALILMPHSAALSLLIPPMFVGAGILMIMDASINVAMEPFRALIADMLPNSQRTLGFSVQTFLIGVGAVIGSWLPYMLGNWFGVPVTATPGHVPPNLTGSFYIGAAILLGAILWTIFSTREYSPQQLEQFGRTESETRPKAKNSILQDILHMPKTMFRLGIVQFFSWFALFSMWVYSTPAVADRFFQVTDPQSPRFQEAGNWVGILFGVYNAVAMLFALLIPAIAKKIGRRTTHAAALCCGALGLISFAVFSSPNELLISMIGIGIAWASILAMPYAMLASSIPVRKMGVYMGLFNFFITFPQIVNGIFNGPIVKWLYHGNTIYAITTAGIFMFIAAISVFFVRDNDRNIENS